jgi:hypothetical protein
VAQIARELGIGPVALKKLVRDRPWARVIGSRTFVEVAEFQGSTRSGRSHKNDTASRLPWPGRSAPSYPVEVAMPPVDHWRGGAMKKRAPFEAPKHQRNATNVMTPQATAFRHSRPRKGSAAPPAPKPEPPGTSPEPVAGEHKPST